MEADQQESVNLYEYFLIQCGMRPEASMQERYGPDAAREARMIEQKFRSIPMNSPMGKMCKKSIDGAVALMGTFPTQEFDLAVVSLLASCLGAIVFEKSGVVGRSWKDRK